MKVLVAEDEIRIREGIVKLLQKIDSEKYQVVAEAADGEQGLVLSQTYKPDLIITDIRMPKMDGLEMLGAISDKGIKSRAIVISAYSEFEYARGAMKLGVTEYLLKPISVMDFSKSLDNITQQLEEDNRRKPEQVGTLDQIFRDIMFGHKDISSETADYLNRVYHISENQNFLVLCAYLGNSFEEKREYGYMYLRNSFSGYGDISYVIIDSQYHNSIVMLMYKYKDGHDIERFIQYQLLSGQDNDIVIGCEEKEGLEGLKNGLNNLYPYMDWNISFEKDIVISYPKITKVQTAVCIYPIEHENALKTSIFEKNEARVKATIEKFNTAFLDGKIYNPREVKECYVRFLWTMLEIGKEAGCRKEGNIQRQKILDWIMNAKTHQELKAICIDVLNVFEFKEKKLSSNHLMVRKAESMIKEFYNTGITLDEIAIKLNITPEYLGTQFHKETGMTYSAYMKDYRITKAKELLISTNLKLYDISDKVGYQDPKYFSKVFREVTGMLPAEYRRTIK